VHARSLANPNADAKGSRKSAACNEVDLGFSKGAEFGIHQ
jgi:hypothetical protein